MLSINRIFDITAYARPEDEKMIEDKLNKLDIHIDDKNYYGFMDSKHMEFGRSCCKSMFATVIKVRWDCRASEKSFDKMVEYLEKEFNSNVTLAY